MSAVATVVDTGALVQVIWVSLIASVAVVMIYSFALLGLTRAAEARREGRTVTAAVFGALGAAALALFAAVIVVGVTILVS
jgi:hypothetical protein